jgi:hypothetical protein
MEYQTNTMDSQAEGVIAEEIDAWLETRTRSSSSSSAHDEVTVLESGARLAASSVVAGNTAASSVAAVLSEAKFTMEDIQKLMMIFKGGEVTVKEKDIMSMGIEQKTLVSVVAMQPPELRLDNRKDIVVFLEQIRSFHSSFRLKYGTVQGCPTIREMVKWEILEKWETYDKGFRGIVSDSDMVQFLEQRIKGRDCRIINLQELPKVSPDQEVYPMISRVQSWLQAVAKIIRNAQIDHYWSSSRLARSLASVITSWFFPIMVRNRIQEFVETSKELDWDSYSGTVLEATENFTYFDRGDVVLENKVQYQQVKRRVVRERLQTFTHSPQPMLAKVESGENKKLVFEAGKTLQGVECQPGACAWCGSMSHRIKECTTCEPKTKELWLKDFRERNKVKVRVATSSNPVEHPEMVEGLPMKWLADSGATNSCIGRERWEEIKEQIIRRGGRIELPAKEVEKVQLADKGTCCKVIGVAALNFKAPGKKEKSIKTLVIDADMGNTFLIGCDEFEEQGLKGMNMQYLESLQDELSQSEGGHNIMLQAIQREQSNESNEEKNYETPVLRAIRAKDDEQVLSLTPEEQISYDNFMKKLPNLLVIDESKPAKVRPVEVKLKEGAEKVVMRTRRFSKMDQDFIDETIEELKRLGRVFEGESEWASLISIVRDEGRKPRMVMDLRKVNQQITVIPVFMENIEEIGVKIANSKFFSIIDLRSAFWQIPLSAAARGIFAFLTHKNKIIPERVPMGYTNAVQELEMRLREVLKPLLGVAIILFVDDILVFGSNVEELLTRVEQVLKLLQEANLAINQQKSIFIAKEVKFVGRLISRNGIRFDPKDLQAVHDLPPPENAKELQHFLAAANFFRMALPDFARIASPLTNYLNEIFWIYSTMKGNRVAKVKVEWSEVMKVAFEKVKLLLEKSIILTTPAEDDEIYLFSDASQDGYGAVITTSEAVDKDSPSILERHHKPIAFISGIFRKAQRSWSVSEKELYAVLVAVERADSYYIERKDSTW